MADIKFKDSEFKFTDPIRKFKANDPADYNIDNLPICELEQNDRWLKDQLSGARVTNVVRADLAELKPFINGEDNIVRVNPGRFIGRVNDAYDLDRLQILDKILGQNINEEDQWSAKTYSDADLKAILDRFKSNLSADALGVNGLIERVTSWATRSPDLIPSELLDNQDITYSNNSRTGLGKPPFPLQEALLWANDSLRSDYIVRTLTQIGRTEAIPVAESHWIKFWRSIARTAVVDIPNELQISVPAFDSNDFFYIDDKGQRQLLPAESRIDLIFIYTKAVDTSSTTVASFSQGSPRTISTPQLGRVHGAGIGINFQDIGEPALNFNSVEGQEDGVIKILPCVGDQFNPDNGFSGINVHGSFPAPDDLMNLTPQLAENLFQSYSDKAISLIGQSVLPVAYVVVKNTDSINSSNQTILSDSSLVDIRPFFRTAELSYNERTGIAAAYPQLSLANPAVGKVELDFEMNRHYRDLLARINGLTQTVAAGPGSPTEPRSVANGYVFGGSLFGPEAALLEEIKASQGLSVNSYSAPVKGQLSARLSLPSTVVIPDYPDWDLSKWCEEGTFASKGNFPNDYINYCIENGSNIADYGAAINQQLNQRATRLGTDNIEGNVGLASIYFVKKTIAINRDAVPWMVDYDVDVTLQNCLPLTCRLAGFNQDSLAGGAGIWVEKNVNSFTIYCAWVAADFVENGIENQLLGGAKVPPDNRDSGGSYAGFSVINNSILQGPDTRAFRSGESPFGVSIYPTISFNVVGIPSSFRGYYPGVPRTNSAITLY